MSRPMRSRHNSGPGRNILSFRERDKDVIKSPKSPRDPKKSGKSSDDEKVILHKFEFLLVKNYKLTFFPSIEQSACNPISFCLLVWDECCLKSPRSYHNSALSLGPVSQKFVGMIFALRIH